jgi:hypothetical protein
MSERNRAFWYAVISFVMGLCIGMGLVARVASRDLQDWTAKSQATTAKYEQLMSDTNVQWKGTIDALTACNQRALDARNTWTVLFERSTTPITLSLFRGLPMPGIGLGDPSFRAAWILPQKLTPFPGDPQHPENAGVYYYFDQKTKRLDGPYVPQPPSAE